MIRVKNKKYINFEFKIEFKIDFKSMFELKKKNMISLDSSLRVGASFTDKDGKLVIPVMILQKGLIKLRENKLEIMNDRLVGKVPENLQNVRFEYTPSGAPYVVNGIDSLVDFFDKE